MQSSSHSGASPLVIIGAGLLILYVAVSILLGDGNTMGSLFFYLLIFGGVFGMMAPKGAFYLFIFLCGYLDLLKRLMVVAGSVSVIDLYYVLGIAPVTVTGVLIGVVVRMFFGKMTTDRSDLFRFVTVVTVIGAGAALSFRGGGGMGGAMREVASSYFYVVLIFIVPVLFKTPEEVKRLISFTMLIFVPVALYGIFQQLNGFQNFEIDYLKTGMSIEIKQLYADRVRAFSTLNSPTSLAVVCSELASFAFLLAFVGRKNPQYGLSQIYGFALAVIFFGGLVASSVRVGFLLIPVAIVAFLLFRSARLTAAFYAVSILVFLTLVILSPFLLANIDAWTIALLDVVGDVPFWATMLDARTYKDRLMGFDNVLSNPAAYTLLGKSNADSSLEFYNHDPLSAALLNFGLLPLLVGLLITFLVIRYLHRCIYRTQDPGVRGLSLVCLSIVAGSLSVSMLGGNLISTFPSNVFFMIPIGLVIALTKWDRLNRRAVPAKVTEPQPVPKRVVFPMRPRWQQR